MLPIAERPLEKGIRSRRTGYRKAIWGSLRWGATVKIFEKFPVTGFLGRALLFLSLLSQGPAYAALSSISIAPLKSTISIGQIQPFTATGTFADGSLRALTATPFAGGDQHTCAVVSDGTVQCWGKNDHGQLGDGTTTDSSTPVTVLGINNAVSVATGQNHSCAALATGYVNCWGANDQGQLGDGTTTEHAPPVQVRRISNATAVFANANRSCALLADGFVQCWGAAYLGNGSGTDSPGPVRVSRVSNAIAVAVGRGDPAITGAGTSCVVIADGSVWCWGDGSNGELGNGTTNTILYPVKVNDITNATAAAAGENYACALLANGSVKCWGKNDVGQLGLGPGDTTSYSIPEPVKGIDNAISISAHYQHTCAALATGGIKCWGADGNGQLGNDSVTGYSTTPVAVNGITDAAAVSVGNSRSCALLKDGSLWCWGGGSSTPTSVSGMPPSGLNALQWMSGDSLIATISGSGTAFGVYPGATTVTATVNGTAAPANTDLFVGIYGIGGTITGVSDPVTLKDNGTDSQDITADGDFTFSTKLATGAIYNVTADSTTQTCSTTNGSGTVGNSDITNIAITCGPNPPGTYIVGGTISGLSGNIVLEDKGTDSLPLRANGSFTFPTFLSDGSDYRVTVATQPAGQICTVSNGTGIINGSNVTDVAVTCTFIPPDTYKVGGTISGLTGGIAVLKNKGTDALRVYANGNFTFSTAQRSGTLYNVSVTTQPAGQSCAVEQGSGTVGAANVTSIEIQCAPLAPVTYKVGGTISGLSGGTMVLTDNGSDALPVSTNGSFTFLTALDGGAAYDVAVATQPAGQICTVTNGTGTITNANANDIAITCAADSASGAPVSNDDGSGGGGTGPITLGLLALLLVVQRELRRRNRIAPAPDGRSA
jgi:alpha-tubulin suppressor-like RCC1 family protein